MVNSKKRPEIGIGVDVGTTYAAISISDGRKTQAIESPRDGSQIPTIVFIDPNSGQAYVGKEAVLRSYEFDGDNLHMHAKRRFTNATALHEEENSTPLRVTTELVRFIKQLLLSTVPELREYPQFGGTARSSDDLGLIFTIPGTWGIEPHTAYEKAILQAGIKHFDGFVSEPVAAARSLSNEHGRVLADGHRIFVVDIGGGTTDITALELRNGIYHQIAASTGDANLAGLDFTNAIAAEIARQHSIRWEDVYDQNGLHLEAVETAERPRVMACWEAGEEIKKNLSVVDETAVAVDFPGARKAFSFSRVQAHELWKPLIERFSDCVSKALEGTTLTFDKFDHAMLAGGSSLVPGLCTALAEVMGRDESAILVSSKSDHIVSHGAAQHAFFQDEASQSLESGIGFTVVDSESKCRRHWLMVPPGEIIPPEGLYLERSGFNIAIHNGEKVLALKPFVCRSGVHASVVAGRDTFLENSEIVSLQEVQSPLDGLPHGDHPVAVGIKVDPNRKLRLLCKPTMLSDVETLSIPLVMGKDDGNNNVQYVTLDIVLILDGSKSMKGVKLEMLKRGASRFAASAIQRGASVGLVVLPASKSPANVAAQVLSPPTDNLEKLSGLIHGLAARGGTPLDAGLELAEGSFPRRDGDVERVAVMFTDGMPHDCVKAGAAARSLKTSARLIAVGIGEDVNSPFLRSLASSSTDYYYAECGEAILDAFVHVAELVWRDRRPAPEGHQGDESVSGVTD